ncbi:hypothetical protein TSUD_309480 [Trifolium subterraneum]|uniref:non-specific serine/threonine protein kinase n=1 Tax=Trifolium subterraneum TaxID=3900 RepID=A0A2Z6LS04_TRISU|nr:hypothetical protein TSUD_309480 [Trifolium subterraneum]
MAPSANSPGGAVPLLTKQTLGLKFYYLILIFVAILIAVILLIVICIRRNRSTKKSKMRVKHSSGTIPLVSKEIVEVIKIEQRLDDESKMQKQVKCEIEECSSVSVEGQAEKEFKVEVEAIGKVRHKNLVGLVGYCADGAQRMLVYEYVDNGNLEQWLHGDVGPVSPLTWDIRMKIAVGTAKGCVC